MKGPTLLDLGKFIGKAATFAAKAAGVTQTIAAATGTLATGSASNQLDEAVHELQVEAIELEKRLQDMANDEARDEQQMGELQQKVDELAATAAKWQDAYLAADREIALLRFNVSCIAEVVGPTAIQDVMKKRGAAVAASSSTAAVPTVDGTNWQGMKGSNGATASTVDAADPAPTWDKDFAKPAGGADAAAG